eukprot:jgi/Galph1/1463/GphlegSOOS_G148.1
MKRSEFFDWHYGNCHYGFVPCEYCHFDIPSHCLLLMLLMNVYWLLVLVVLVAIFFNLAVHDNHVENECVKRGLLSKHESEAMKEHFYLVKQNTSAPVDKVTARLGKVTAKTGRIGFS